MIDDALTVVEELAPTLAFLAALLVLAEGCRREGLFAAAGAWLGRARSGRLQGRVFVLACAVTVVLSLDATVLLLTPVVLAAARRARAETDRPLLATVHLANSASLLLPISNLTNLLAFRASELSFARFTLLMALPFAVVVAIEWLVLRVPRAPATRSQDLPPGAEPARAAPFAIAVVGATLVALVALSAAGVEPVFAAAAGALVLAARTLMRPLDVVRAAKPGFALVVLGLGIVVELLAPTHLIEALLPAGESLGALVLVTLVAAALPNLVNNLPATLVLVPLVAPIGPAAVLAALIGLNAGPNLTPHGSLATVLWRKVLREHDAGVAPRAFYRAGLLATPAILVLAPAALWVAVQATA